MAVVSRSDGSFGASAARAAVRTGSYVMSWTIAKAVGSRSEGRYGASAARAAVRTGSYVIP